MTPFPAPSGTSCVVAIFTNWILFSKSCALRTRSRSLPLSSVETSDRRIEQRGSEPLTQALTITDSSPSAGLRTERAALSNRRVSADVRPLRRLVP